MSIQTCDLLRNTFGHDIILLQNSSDSTVYRIVVEFTYQSSHYAVLQSEKQRKDDEVSLFKVNRLPQDPFFDLETIDDEDEWETVAELYDEWIFMGLHKDSESQEP